VKTWFQNRRMKQKKMHRKGSECSVLDPVTSPLSIAGETTFTDDDPGNDVIDMAVCFPGHVTAKSSAESALRRAAFEQKQRLYDDAGDEDNINVDSTDTESDADL